MRIHRTTILMFVSVLLAITSTSPLVADERFSLRAGAAAVEISPETLPALQNGGFLQRVTDQVLDSLYARALVISDGHETLAIVIVDSCMFPTELCDQIKRLAAEQTGIPTNRILISATHTHSAPAAMMCLGCAADEPYLQFVPERVAQAIADADRNLQPAKLGWAIVDGADLTNCRRWITRSDRMGVDPFGKRTVRAMMHPGYQNPDYTSPAGPIDPWLSVLSVVSATDSSPICVMGNLSMHYFGGAGFSADYFGEVARLLEARVGNHASRGSADFVGIMSQGTSGDLHWMDYSKPRQGISRQQYSESVTDRIIQALQGMEYRSDMSLAMAEKRLTVGRRLPSEARMEWASPINAGRGDVPPRDRVEVYAQQAEWLRQHPTTEVVLQAVRIGELAITAIPNEVYGITGLKLKRQSPLAATFNLELANGATGYIPPPEQHRLGGYTTWPARTAGLAEEAEPLIVETLLGLLESVSGKPRRAVVPSSSTFSDAVTRNQPVAYWQLEDMNSTQVTDAVGNNHSRYHGGVALFLPGPPAAGFTPMYSGNAAAYGSRSVYLAGGHIEADVPQIEQDYSVTMWFANALPTDARAITGTLLSTENETLLIAGSSAKNNSGRLVLHSGQQSVAGKTTVSTNRWHHVTVTRKQNHLRVYLDGRPEPEIDTQIAASKPLTRLLIGSDGESASTFDGKVDDVAVFDRSITANDVAALYVTSGMSPPPRPRPAIVLGPKPGDAASSQKYADAVLASQPIAFWRLHDDNKQWAADSAGKHTATYEDGAAPLQSGIVQPNFSGGRVKAKVPELSDTYSVELWFRNELPVGSRPVTAYLFSRAVDGIEGASGDNLGLGGTHSNSGRLIVFNGNTRNELVAGQTPIPPGSWSHVVLVRQQQNMLVYLNGDPQPEISARLPVAWPADCQDILAGGRADNFANLHGMLEEVAIYDRALTPAEIQTHFQAAAVRQIQHATADTSAATDEPTPTDARQYLDAIHVRDGFEVQLVAAEPLVMDPVAIDWGPDGKLWVIEMADYPLGIDGQGQPGGRVRFLEDVDGDGNYETSTLFADGLSFPTGVLTWGRGILVTAAPQIIYLEDSSGDGKADIRSVLYSGFLEGNQQLRVNGLRWGLDNWVYCASGSHHAGYGKESRITSHLTGKKYGIGSRDFRIRPDTGAIDPQSGPSQYGRNRDDWGNWFGVQNSHPLWHYVLADHNIRRNPHFAPPDPKHQVVTPANPRVYPASTLQKRFHSFNQSGRFTSACSAMIYRDDLLFARGPEQHAFTCEPFHNLVQHNLITDDDVSFDFRRDPAEPSTDFFASKDRWCRPVMARTGPDGGLWVVDMYRYMIEHPQWLPQQGKDELRPWYRAGEDRGRIYRVVRRDRPKRKVPRLADLSDAELIATLESSNGWQRDTAQRLLVRGNLQSGDAHNTIAALRELATTSQEPLARVHALWTLAGPGQLSHTTLEAALSDDHPGVRRNAVQLAAEVTVDIDRLTPLTEDPDAKVRLELACTLGNYDAPTASDALARLAATSHSDPYITAAVISSLNPRNVSVVASAVIQSGGNNEDLTLTVIEQTIAMGDAEAIDHLATLVCSRNSSLAAAHRFRSLATVLDGLSARKLTYNTLSDFSRQSIVETVEHARAAAADQKTEVLVRTAAIRLLGRGPGRREDDFALMRRLLVPQSPVDVQRAVVMYLATQSESEIAEILLDGWSAHSPELRNLILDVVARRSAWAEALRQRLASQTIHVSELSTPIRQRLLELGANAAQWQQALAVKASQDRAQVLRDFRPALQLTGDDQRGSVLFRKLCITCHKVGNEGHDVGPQLASITDKSPATLLNSILDPNAAVDAKYFNYTIVTNDGQVFTGRLETETGSSITLLAAEGKRTTILRRDIEELQASARSVMPNGLERELTPQDLADLIQFVRATFQ